MAQPKDPYTSRTPAAPAVVTPPYVPPQPPAPVPVVPPPVTLPVTGGNVPTVPRMDPVIQPGRAVPVAPTQPYVPPAPRVPTYTQPPKTYPSAPPNRYYTPMPEADRNRYATPAPTSPWGSTFATPAAPMAGPAPSANQYGGTGNAMNSTAPGGVDQQWWDEFTREHNGRTPEDVYHGDIDAALRDRAWGDQFYRTYGRPPSEYDWKASYYTRRYGPSGGGGGGGGYGGGSASGATGLPAMWNALFSTWYTTNPTEQAAADYERFQQTWLARANTLPTTQQADQFLMLFAQYVQNVLGKTLGNATPAEMQQFMDRYLTQTPTPPPTAPLNLGEI